MLKLTVIPPLADTNAPTRVVIEGVLDASGVSTVGETIREIRSSVLDVRGVTSFDAAGVTFLAACRARGSRVEGCSLYLNELLRKVTP